MFFKRDVGLTSRLFGDRVAPVQRTQKNRRQDRKRRLRASLVTTWKVESDNKDSVAGRCPAVWTGAVLGSRKGATHESGK